MILATICLEIFVLFDPENGIRMFLSLLKPQASNKTLKQTKDNKLHEKLENFNTTVFDFSFL